jgi:predicted RNase H-like HicB family nuclease
MNNELTFLVESDPEGGYTARALEESIFTDADTLEELRLAIKDAVECHFEPEQQPKFVRLQIIHQELLEIA